MKTVETLRVILVDPSLYTAPYDAALTEGLLGAAVEPTWAVRPTRAGDRAELAAPFVDALFYRRVDRLSCLPPRVRAALKGLAHVAGLVRLMHRVVTEEPDIVHFQWTVVPTLDALALLVLRRRCPVVLTVHDTVPFNGERLSFWQNHAFDLPVKLCDSVIVHTQSGRDALIRRGISAEKVTVIPHGPLQVHRSPSPRGDLAPSDRRRTLVLFGELKPYKGIDLVVEALALLPSHLRDRARVIIAGRPRMNMAPLVARIAELHLEGVIELRDHRLSEQEMADLFDTTDCFLFPYRQVDASGVYYLVKSLGKWIIASKVGIFAEDLEDGVRGTLVGPNDARALADAMARDIASPATPPPSPARSEWAAIGSATRDLYERTKRASRRAVGPTRRAVVFALPLAAMCALSTRAAAAQAPGPLVPAAPVGLTIGDGYKIVKNWDFAGIIRDDAALRAEFFTRYVYGDGTLDHLNNEWSRYRDAENHVFTSAGLSLVARVSGVLAPGSVESGMLRSRWSGQFGVFEIRMKVPRARGAWPAFWLNPQDRRWPPEIDVVEIVNNGRDTTRQSFHFLHGVGAKNASEAGSKLGSNHAYVPGIDYAAAFHVFSVEWTPERVRHFVDGVMIADREYRFQHDDGSDGGAAHVLVNLAVGGDWPGSPTSLSAFPISLEIDYVRVWQR